MSPLERALANRGKSPLFFCLENKRPACPHGFKDAVADGDAIAALWRQYPGPLIGMPTGTPSGIDVLDIDIRHHGDDWLEESREALPLTRCHTTRSNGFHFCFRADPAVRNSESKIAPGVDVRGTGGYIIRWDLHGFPVANYRYIEDWPRWLLKIIVPPRPRPPPALPVTKVEADMRAAIMLERAFAKVRNAAPGQRHYALRAAAATLGGLQRFFPYSPQQIEDQLVGLIMSAGGKDQRNAERTVQWAMEKGARSPLLEGPR